MKKGKLRYYLGRLDIFKDKSKMVVCGVSSVTSPRREPCVCHTQTEKQALHNRSVKSPCSKTGAGEGGSSAASGKKSWCTQMTSGRANDPWIHQEISVPPQLRSRDKAPSCTDGDSHTRHRGNINYGRRHVWWKTIPAYLEEQFLKLTLVWGDWVPVIPTLSFPCWAIIKVKTVSCHTLHHFILFF